MKIIPVVLAGGGGTRFWPKSRKRKPKPFISLGNKPPTIVSTYKRLVDFADEENIYMSVGAHILKRTHKILPKIAKRNIIVESEARNTAPAIAAATWILGLDYDPDDVLVFCPADHEIDNSEAFSEAINKAVVAATLEPGVVLLGLVPQYPSTSYGYIGSGYEIDPDRPELGMEVKNFYEKPDKSRAKKYYRSGHRYWNSGYFIGTIASFKEIFSKHGPDYEIWAEKEAELRGHSKADSDEYKRVSNIYFPRMREESFDYAILEYADGLRFIPSQFGWVNIGSWNSIRVNELRHPTSMKETDNITHGSVVEIDCEGCYIESVKGKTIAVLGAKDMIVVDTGDAVLVVPTDRADEVRRIVEELREKELEDIL